MFKKDDILSSQAEFDLVTELQLPIIVWQHGQILDYGGPIIKHTEGAVYLGNRYYLKSQCVFKVREVPSTEKPTAKIYQFPARS